MLEQEQKISLAIDGGHNIRPDIEKFMRHAGFRFELKRNGNLHAEVIDDPLLGSITLNRGPDIPLRLSEAVNDLAVLGRDVVRDAQLGGIEIEEIEALGISICRVVLEVPQQSGYSHPRDLNGARIATSLPNITTKFFRDHDTEVRIVPYSGKEEGAPAAGAADAVVAIYNSGRAATDNTLRPISTIDESTLLESEAVVASHANFMRERGSDLIVIQFIDRFRQAVRQPRRSINGNVSPRISAVIPQVA